jgi:UDP-glucose 4-epimerase
LQCVEAVTERTVPVTERARRNGDPVRLVASVDRAAQVLDWRPRRDLGAMIADAWAGRPVAAAS